MIKATPAIDAHCHLSDLRIFPDRQAWISRMNELGIKWFAMGGVNPLEWNRQKILASEFPNCIVTCFGLHPYYVSEKDSQQISEDLNILETSLSNCDLLGETGLDFRKEILKDRLNLQTSTFQRQLELSQKHRKPVVLHVVRAHNEALLELKEFKVSGLVHSFSSSIEIAEQYLDLNLFLSLGATALRPQHAPLIAYLPLDRILLESDAPDQPPRGFKEHDSSTILLLAQMIADNKGLTADQVLEKTRENFETLLGRRLP